MTSSRGHVSRKSVSNWHETRGNICIPDWQEYYSAINSIAVQQYNHTKNTVEGTHYTTRMMQLTSSTSVLFLFFSFLFLCNKSTNLNKSKQSRQNYFSPYDFISVLISNGPHSGQAQLRPHQWWGEQHGQQKSVSLSGTSQLISARKNIICTKLKPIHCLGVRFLMLDCNHRCEPPVNNLHSCPQSPCSRQNQRGVFRIHKGSPC